MTRRGEHASDDPGCRRENRRETDRHPHSGRGTGSLPRHTGTGERQAPRRHYNVDHPPYADEPMVPGEVLYGDDPVVINAGKEVLTLRVENTADRPIQVGSHYHFAEVNAALAFDRQAAWGHRLNVLAGGSMRFEPGAVEEVELVPLGGQRVVAGLRGLCGGALDG